MFTKSAAFYDALYHWKDYKAESQRLHNIIQQHKKSDGHTLLDVACGTGAHITHLKDIYQIEGLDLEGTMLNIARERHPELTFHEANMTYFDLGKTYDVVLCLFSSIGYVKQRPALRTTLEAFKRHLKPGGVVIVEPWFGPEEMIRDSIHAHYVDEPDLKVARMNLTEVHGRVSVMKFHYLVGTPDGIEQFTELHELGLFTDEEYKDAFLAADLKVTHDPEGLMGRGLYVGVR